MGIGDAPLPVASAVEANNPVPNTGDDPTNHLNSRLTVLERTGTAQLSKKIDDLIARVDSLTGTFVVATTTPFTVFLDGAVVAVPGLKVVGLTYAVGNTGRYILDPDDSTPSVLKPLCFRTA